MDSKKILVKIIRISKNIINLLCIKLQEEINIIKYFFIKPDFFLIGTPLHGNLGDHAIAVAELQWLNSHFKEAQCMEITGISYSRNKKLYHRLIKKWEQGVIFISGGGFLGSLWPEEEQRVLDIISTFSKRNIVIFPQTIYYDLTDIEGRDLYDQAYNIYKKCKNLLLVLREEVSMSFVEKYFPDIKKIFIPDMVFYMGEKSFNVKRKGILYCLRKDKEGKIDKEELQIIKSKVKNKFFNEEVRYTDTVLNRYLPISIRKKEVEKKLQEFASSKIVITDRLHGMIFAAITGTPCVVLPSKSWKVRGVYEYIKNNEYIIYLENIEEIDSILLELSQEKVYRYQINEDYESLFVEVQKIIK